MMGLKVLIVTVFITCGLSYLAVAQTVQTGVGEWAPYIIYDRDNVKGLVVDILKDVSKRTGYSFVYHKLPTKRSQAHFKEGWIALDPASNPAWRKEYEAISCYSVPYYRVITVILGKKGRITHATGPEDFRGMVIGGQLGYSGYGDGFDKAFADGTIRREDVVSGAEGNIQKLAADRVDAILIDRLVAWYTIQSLGLNPDDFEEVYQFKTEEYLFMRFHTSREALLPKVNTALEAMKAEGTIGKISEHYTTTSWP